MKQHADSVYCSRYYESGEGGTGRQATNLAIYPFLKDILHHVTSNTRETQYCRDISAFAKPSVRDEDNYEQTSRYTNTIYNTGIHYGQRLCSRNRSEHSQSKSETSHNEKVSSFSLFSGHDTVILPVLTALGVFKPINGDVGDKTNLRGKHETLDEMHCEWPPYASRIVFEVYNPNSLVDSKHQDSETKKYQRNFPFFLPFKSTNRSISNGHQFVGEHEEHYASSMSNGSVSSLLNLYGSASASYLYEPYIRILYNGKVITPYIGACKAYHRMVLHNKVKQSEALRRGDKKKSNTRPTVVGFIETNSILDNKYHNGVLLSTDVCPLSVYEAHLESIVVGGGGKLTDKESGSRGPFYKDGYQYVNNQYKNRCNKLA